MRRANRDALFVLGEQLAGGRGVSVGWQRMSKDWVEQVWTAGRGGGMLVFGNLDMQIRVDTYRLSALTQVRSRELVQRIELRYTPKLEYGPDIAESAMKHHCMRGQTGIWRSRGRRSWLGPRT